MHCSQLSQARSILIVAVLTLTTITPARSQETARRLVAGSSVKEFVLESADEKLDGISQIAWRQLSQLGRTESAQARANELNNTPPLPMGLILFKSPVYRVDTEANFFLSRSQRSRHFASKHTHQKQIVFEYDPSGLDAQTGESVFSSVAVDGVTQVVRYRSDNRSIIGVYEGRLLETERAKLVSQSESLIPKASDINKPYVGSCDADSFSLSLVDQNHIVDPSTKPDRICLLAMTKEIRDLVEELRTLWKRMSATTLSYGYGKVSPAKRKLSAAETKEKPVISIRRLTPTLKNKVRTMTKNSPKFIGLSNSEYDQLLALSSGSSRFYVRADGGFFLVELLLSRSRESGSIPWVLKKTASENWS
jgi:hypothetical protein